MGIFAIVLGNLVLVAGVAWWLHRRERRRRDDLASGRRVQPPARPQARETPVQRLAALLIGLSLLSLWFTWPTFWTWAHNPGPEVLTLEDFIAHGSRGEWLMLTEVYGGADQEVSTMVTQEGHAAQPGQKYYGLTTGPEDRRPVKVFLRPAVLGYSGAAYRKGQMIFKRNNESDADFGKRADAVDGPIRQVVSGVLASSLDYGNDLRDLLQHRGAPDAVLLLLNERPADPAVALSALLIPLGVFATGVVIAIRSERRRPAGAGSAR
jgi:hypothetical protein